MATNPSTAMDVDVNDITSGPAPSPVSDNVDLNDSAVADGMSLDESDEESEPQEASSVSTTAAPAPTAVPSVPMAIATVPIIAGPAPLSALERLPVELLINIGVLAGSILLGQASPALRARFANLPGSARLQLLWNVFPIAYATTNNFLGAMRRRVQRWNQASGGWTIHQRVDALFLRAEFGISTFCGETGHRLGFSVDDIPDDILDDFVRHLDAGHMVINGRPWTENRGLLFTELRCYAPFNAPFRMAHIDQELFRRGLMTALREGCVPAVVLLLDSSATQWQLSCRRLRREYARQAGTGWLSRLEMSDTVLRRRPNFPWLRVPLGFRRKEVCRRWAVDRSLILYCVRHTTEYRYLYDFVLARLLCGAEFYGLGRLGLQFNGQEWQELSQWVAAFNLFSETRNAFHYMLHN